MPESANLLGERRPGDCREGDGRRAPMELKRVIEFIAANYDRSIKVEELARQAGLSRFHFSRRFKQWQGRSPHQYLMDVRLAQARRMLSRPGLPLADIAFRCGFADQAHFSRRFKQAEGLTPKAYRSIMADTWQAP